MCSEAQSRNSICSPVASRNGPWEDLNETELQIRLIRVGINLVPIKVRTCLARLMFLKYPLQSESPKARLAEDLPLAELMLRLLYNEFSANPATLTLTTCNWSLYVSHCFLPRLADGYERRTFENSKFVPDQELSQLLPDLGWSW